MEQSDELNKLVSSCISSVPGFVKSETFVIFSEIKPDHDLSWLTEAKT